MQEPSDNEDVEMIPDDEMGAGDAQAKVAKLKDAMKRLEAEKREYLDGWQRAKADLANYKKDEMKRFEEFSRYAAETIVGEVTQVLDSFDLALKHAMPKDVEQGVVMIRSQLEDVLRRNGLEVIHATGKKFDPMAHESVGEVESDGEEGMVAEELQKGYALHGKVIRPARVKISKKT